MFRVSIFLVVLLGLLSTSFGYFSVGSDDSGKYLAIADRYNGIYVSSNYGAKWTWSSAHATNTWTGLSSDGSGKNLAISSSASLPYLSNDAGVNWAPASSGNSTNSLNIASEGAGKKLVLAGIDDLYLSTDGGANWAAANIKPYAAVPAVDYSADGSAIIYAQNGYISIAKNGRWGPTASPAGAWYGVSTNNDGSVIAGVVYDPNAQFDPNAETQRGVYLSTNGGASYTTLVVSVKDSDYYYSVEVSDDGKLVFFGGSNGLSVYNVASKSTTLSDLPVKPVPNDNAIYSIASSQNGQYAVASSANSFVWVSSNYGVNWIEAKWYM